MSQPELNEPYKPDAPEEWRKLAIIRSPGDFFYCNTCPDCTFRDPEDIANHYLELHSGKVLFIHVDPEDAHFLQIVIGLPRLS